MRFIYKECEKLYGRTGKPSIDPVVFFKLELYGYFENIISDRELIRKANDSLAARYFIGYDIDEKLPWHSTISRTRGLISKESFEKIFNRILELCYKSGLIEGKHQSIDSTLVKANASLESVERKEPELTVEEYINKTYEENKEEEPQKEDDQEKGNKGQKAELRIEEISADKGYCSGKNLRALEQREIKAFIPTQEYVNRNGKINNKEFIYNEEKDQYVCPKGKELAFYSYEKKKHRKRYRAGEKDCLGCPMKQECCPDGKRRSVSRTIYYKEYERLDRRLKTPEARRASVIRKTVSEGLFAEAKMYHGLRKFMTRGIDKAQKRSYMIASVQNLKRLIGYTNRKIKRAVQIIGNILTNKFFHNNFELCPNFE